MFNLLISSRKDSRTPPPPTCLWPWAFLTTGGVTHSPLHQCTVPVGAETWGPWQGPLFLPSSDDRSSLSEWGGPGGGAPTGWLFQTGTIFFSTLLRGCPLSMAYSSIRCSHIGWEIYCKWAMRSHRRPVCKEERQNRKIGEWGTRRWFSLPCPAESSWRTHLPYSGDTVRALTCHKR